MQSRVAMRGLAILILLLVAGAPASAVTLAPISDAALSDQADLIVVGTVVDRLPGPVEPLPTTDYHVVVERRLKGSGPGGVIRVRVAGGAAPGGRTLVVDGAPRLALGERSLLFLTSAADGAFGVLHLGLGHFTRRGHGAGALAVRSSRLEERALEGELGALRVVRRWDAFTDWLAERAAGRRLPAGYLELTTGPELAALESSRERAADDPASRWFVFDFGGRVGWHFVKKGSPRGTKASLKRSLAAWTRVKRASVDLFYAGKTRSTIGLQTLDGLNTLVFGDPNRIIPGRYSCRSGGILATAGWWIDGVAGEHRGVVYLRIFEAEIVVNDGAGCFAAGNKKGLDELLAHELGHTLGLPHTCGDAESGGCRSQKLRESLMRAYLHDDGRGGKLNGRDRRDVRRRYWAPF